MTGSRAPATEPGVLGYAQVEVDVRAMIAALRPGESLKFKPGEQSKRVPILVVHDASWRRGIER
jgi:hypothetical protein